MAAAAVCLARGVAAEAVREGLATFAGVPHRLEEIGTVGGVLYVNDSKATNVASAEVGIGSFAGGVHLIARRPREGRRLHAAGRAGARALRRRLPDRRDRRAAARRARARPACRSTTAGTSRRAFAAPRGRGAAGRRRAALAGLRVLRPVPRPSRSAATTSGARRRAALNARAGRRERHGVRRPACRSRRRCRRAAAARAPPAAHRHLLPARGRRGDGLLGLVGAHAAAGPGRRHGVPAQVRRLRVGRAGRDARHLAP